MPPFSTLFIKAEFMKKRYCISHITMKERERGKRKQGRRRNEGRNMRRKERQGKEEGPRLGVYRVEESQVHGVALGLNKWRDFCSVEDAGG